MPRVLFLTLALATLGFSQGEDEQFQSLRDQWFYGSRAFPLDHIPAGARLRAIEHLNRMRTEHTDPRAAAPQWTSIGPRGINGNGTLFASGRVSALAVDPRNSNTVYLGGADGGVWKTTDAGASWQPLTDFQASLAIGSLAIDPTNPDTIYAGTGDPNGYLGAGILKSTDAGNTWTLLATQLAGMKVGGLAVHPSNGQIVLAAASGGVFRSADGGKTWTQTLATPAFSLFLNAGGVAYAAIYPGGSSGGVFKSTDAGQTWSAANGSGSSALPFANTAGIRFGVAASNFTTLYASLANGAGALQGVYKSVDGGQNWKTLSGPADYCKPQCAYSNIVAVHPANPNLVYLGGSTSSYRTADGGATWTDVFADNFSLQSDIVHVDSQSYAFSPDGGKMYLGTDGGVTSTTSLDQDAILWKSLNGTLTLTQFYPGISIHPTNTSIGFGGSQDNNTLRFTGSARWDAVQCGDGGQTAIDFKNPSIVYAACTQANLYKSTDGGDSFTPASHGIPPGPVAFIAPLVMDPSNSSRLYFGATSVIVTNDGTATWAAVSPSFDPAVPISAIAVAPNDPNTVYAGNFVGRVEMSKNALAGPGANWTDRSAGLPVRAIPSIAIDPSTATTAYVAVSGFSANTPATPGHVFKTSDGGATWKDVSANLPDVPADDIVVDPDIPNTLYLATDLGVFTTSNGGTSWSPLGAGLPQVAVMGMKLHRQARILRAATYGRGMWDISLPAPGQNPLPAITSLNPPIIAPGGAALTLTLNGSGFVSSTTVQWNGAARAAAFQNSSLITVQVSAADIASAGTALIAAVNPFPAGGTSNTVPLTIGATNGVPTLTAVTPAAIPAGSAATTLTLSGTNFSAGSAVNWNGAARPTTVLSATAIAVSVTAADLAGVAVAAVTVVNASPGGGASNPLNVFVQGAMQDTTFAGNPWFFKGPGSPLSAPLGTISGVAVDPSGSVLFTDTDNCLLLKIASTGAFSLVSGNGNCGRGPSKFRLANPMGVAIDSNGVPYIGDGVGLRVIKVNPDATVSILLGGGSIGISSGDGGPASAAGTTPVWGVAVDKAGNIYFADIQTHSIRKIDTNGIVTTFAGTGQPGYSGDGGPAKNARFAQPEGIAVDSNGNVFIADTFNQIVRKVTPDGTVTTVAGVPQSVSGPVGDNGQATKAILPFPTGVAVDAAGNLYISSGISGHRIRKVTTGGTITTIAGTGTPGFSGDGGLATNAQINLPQAVAVDASGVVYIADAGNMRLRKIVNGIITTVAGNGQFKFAGDNATLSSINLNAPQGVASDPSGNLYIADTGNHRIRKITPAGNVSTVAGNGAAGFSGDNGPAIAAQLNTPVRVAVDPSGVLYIADSGNLRVRRVGLDGVITTYAGGGTLRQGTATQILFAAVEGLALDPNGNLYIGDRCQVVKVSPSGAQVTVAGTLVTCQESGDGGQATAAKLQGPLDVALDPSGNLYALGPNTVRKIGLDGVIHTVAGGGSSFPADGSLGTSLLVGGGTGLATDGAGNVLFSLIYYTNSTGHDSAVYILGPQGNVTTVAGGGEYANRIGITLNQPHGLAVDPQGSLYIADTGNDRIVKVTGVAMAVPPPSVSQGSIINGASFNLDGVVSPWSDTALFGSNLGTLIVAAPGSLPKSLGGTQVLVNGTPAPLFFTSPTQIDFQVPVEATGNTATVQVVTPAGSSAKVNMLLAPASPGIFTALANGQGQGAVLNQNSTVNSASNPEIPGNVIQIFATGLGPATPPLVTGAPANATLPFNTIPFPTVLINGVQATVQFAAGAPGYVSLYQVNAFIPPGTPSGTATLQIQQAGRSSNAVTIAVK